jgi:(p)ppGpp synthase/HD superfamily hydrolase
VLHDIVEDTSCALEEIERNFGVKVANLVEWLTESVLDRKKYAAQARERYLAKLKAAPLDVVVIKLADRLSNVQKLDTHPKVEKQRTYYRETIEKIMPLSKCSPWFSSQFKAWKNQFSFLAESEQS